MDVGSTDELMQFVEKPKEQEDGVDREKCIRDGKGRQGRRTRAYRSVPH